MAENFTEKEKNEILAILGDLKGKLASPKAIQEKVQKVLEQDNSVDLSDVYERLTSIEQQQAQIINLLENKLQLQGELEQKALSLLNKELER